MDLAVRYRARVEMSLVRLVEPVIALLARLHALRIDGLERLPRGPALLVGNHGLLGYETPFFFHALYRATGRMPLGLADRWFFKVPLMREVLMRLGGTYGCRENALAGLKAGNHVVCYPGGAREVLKTPSDRYRLQWQKSRGFLAVAREAGVPIVPFAAAGVDDTFDIPDRIKGTGRFLMGHDKYDLPRLNNVIPRAVPLWFRIGEPISADSTHDLVWQRSQSLLDSLVREYQCAS